MNSTESIFINEDISKSTTFKLSKITSSSPLKRTASVQNGELKITNNFDKFKASVEVIDCYGLLQLKDLIETMDRNTCFSSGRVSLSNQWERFAEISCFSEPKSSTPDEIHCAMVGFEHVSHEPSLMVFECHGLGDTPESSWLKLCSVDPELTKAGYLTVSMPESNIRDESTGSLISPAKSYRHYCVAQNGAWIEDYALAFASRSQIAGIGSTDNVYFDGFPMGPSVKAEALDPNHILMETPPELGVGLYQEGPQIEYHAGEMIDTENFNHMDDFKAEISISTFSKEFLGFLADYQIVTDEEAIRLLTMVHERLSERFS